SGRSPRPRPCSPAGGCSSGPTARPGAVRPTPPAWKASEAGSGPCWRGRGVVPNDEGSGSEAGRGDGAAGGAPRRARRGPTNPPPPRPPPTRAEGTGGRGHGVQGDPATATYKADEPPPPRFTLRPGSIARGGRMGPPLTVEQILAWADAHHDRTGRWPWA